MKIVLRMISVFFLLQIARPGRSTLRGLCEYWIAPAPIGNDTNPGTQADPWLTLEHASDAAADEGCTIWVQPGVYFGNHRLNRRFVLVVFEEGSQFVRSAHMTFSGFRFRHVQPTIEPLVFAIDQNDEGWAEYITLQDNIFHDSYDNDILKIYYGARFITVKGNVFYNQGSGEEHMDVNSVTDVTITGNIFFNDFAGSGRPVLNDTKNFIVIKDSNGPEDGQLGSERITVEGNVFLNWEGLPGEPFIQVGNDGKPYHEARDVLIQNNLFLGNTMIESAAILGVSGARDVIFVNNTVVGDLPAKAYAFRIIIKDQNPLNENIAFYNNIWSDPSGTMGADLSGGENEFSDGDPEESLNLVLDNNLYWNGSEPIPPGDLLSPLIDDPRPLVANPGLSADQDSIILPRWTGDAFLSGSDSIEAEFERLVDLFAPISSVSPAADQADPAFAPAVDIYGRPRGPNPDMGAYEADSVVWTEYAFLPIVVDESHIRCEQK